MMNKGLLLTMLFLLLGVSLHAQSVSDGQMDERFLDNKLPYGWFTEGWVFKDSVAQRKSSMPDMTELFGSTPKNENDSTEVDSTKTTMPEIDMTKLMGSGASYNYLMTPPLSVKSGEVLAFLAKKGGDSNALGSFMGNDDSDSTFVVERCIYGQHMWIKVADFTTELDSVYKTFTVSGTAPGQYRFRFRAGGNVMIDSVAGFHIDTAAPDIYPVYQKKNIQPIDLSVCTQDTTMTFSVINTGTGTLDVAFSADDALAYKLDINQASIGVADTVTVNLTFNYAQAHEGRNSALLAFKTADERVEEIQLPIDAIVSQTGVWTEDFNQNTLPVGWFTEGWTVKDSVATVKQGGGNDMMSMFGGGSSQSFYLMTPPLTVKDVNDVLLFSVMKPGGGGSMDLSSLMGGSSSASPFIVEKSVYGSGKWEKAKDFTNALDTVFTTQWLSGIEPGEYRFRFVASDSIVIDSVAGFQIDMEAPDLYVTLDSAVVKSLDFGLLKADTIKTFTVINTGTGTLNIDVTSLDATRLTVKEPSLAIAAGDSAFVDATLLRDDERQGEVFDMLIFTPTDERVVAQSVAFNGYIIKSDAWSEDFEYEYVVEDDTYPRRFPEGWTTTGWTLTQGGDDDIMALLGGGGGNEEKSWVAKTDSKEYEVVTPRLQAKKGHLLQFTAQMGGAGGIMQMLGMGGGSASYLNIYYKRDNDVDWTFYDTVTSGGTVLFKAPYSGFFRLKFQGEGVSLDNFLGFSLPKDSIEILSLGVDVHDSFAYLDALDGQTWNVVNKRKIAARVNDDGTISPVAATVCLPYDFNIDDYYESGMAKIYQMEYVDTVYSQFIFHEMTDNLMEAGKPYMIVVSRGEIQFNAVDATLTNKLADPKPVYDFTDYWVEDKQTEVATWNGTFDTFQGTDNEYVLNDNGLWSRLQTPQWISPYRAYIRTNETLFWPYYRQNPNTYVNEQPAEDTNDGSLATRFLQPDTDGNSEVTDISNMIFIGDINGTALTAIKPTIQTVDRDGTRQYYDLQGRRLSEKPRKGIYIENGKKHVIR